GRLSRAVVAGSRHAGLRSAGRRHGVEVVLLRRRASILSRGKGGGIAGSDDAAAVFPFMADRLAAREQSRGGNARREDIRVLDRLRGEEVHEYELPGLRIARVVRGVRAGVRIADRVIARVGRVRALVELGLRTDGPADALLRRSVGTEAVGQLVSA